MRLPKQKKPFPSEPSFFKREVGALFYLAIGVFFYLSLLSFHPADPSLNSLSPDTPIHNWGGVVGAYLADLLMTLFGVGAYFVGFFFIFLATLLFVGVRQRLILSDIPIYFTFVVLVSILFQLGMKTFAIDDVTLEAGGLLGGFFGQMGENYLGRPGSYLLVFLGALLTFVWATHISIKQVGGRLVKIFSSLVSYALQKSLIYWVRSQKQVFRFIGFLKKKREQKKEQKKEVKINAAPIPLKLLPPKTASEPKIFDRADAIKKERAQQSQLSLQNLGKDYQLPPISLLNSEDQKTVTIDIESLKMNARLLEKKLLDFNVEGHVTEIHPGPVIAMYEFQPAAGVKLSKIAGLADDLSIAMGGRQVRIVAPLPNKPAVGIEIPNYERETVWLKDIIADASFQKSETKLPFAIGKDIEGHPYVADISKMPHLLVAGATGSGKSVSVNSMILSILYKASPQEVRLIMVDPKMLELSIYEGIPHLLLPVVTDPKKASMALRWAVKEMERRYKLLSDINARHIVNYNQKVATKNFVSKQATRGYAPDPSTGEELLEHKEKLPYIVIMIDELADLMMVSSREVEESITRLAQMARASGIHLILATQRPSVDVITGVIKANFPARMSFKVSSKHDARTVLDRIGSERLLGSGDMLYIPPGASQLIRLHGAYISEEEVGRVVDFLKKQAKPVYDESILNPIETEGVDVEEDEANMDALYDQAVAVVAESKQASISMIQRRLRVGYNRAARMIEKMEAEGIVSPPSSAGQRQVLVSSFEASP